MKYIDVKCPCCSTVLVIDRIDGKIVEERKPLVEQSTGDRFNDALIKSKQHKAETQKKFKESETAHKNRSASLDELFKKSLDRVKKDKDKSKPVTPFDFD